MEKEISSGTMLGIVLIALAAVIGLGFGVFSIAKGVANEGTVNVQDNLGAVSDSAFEDYNDKIVTGTMVKSAVTNFSGKSVAILINTTAMDKGVKVYQEHEGVNGITFNAKGVSSEFTALSGKSVNNDSFDKLNLDAGHHYINYNALLQIGDEGSLDGALTLKDGVYNATSVPFRLNAYNGKVEFDNSVGGFSRTGNCEYLAPTAKFDANLIKEEAGTTIGIVFTQRVQ